MTSPHSASHERGPALDGVPQQVPGEGPDESPHESPVAHGGRARLNRPVLVGNLGSGSCWLLGLLVLTEFYAWPLALLGAGYVIAASVFLAAFYSCRPTSWMAESLAWVVPWAAAVAVWAAFFWWVGSQNLAAPYVEDAKAWIWSVWAGACVATPLYLLWQLTALAARLVYVQVRRPTPSAT